MGEPSHIPVAAGERERLRGGDPREAIHRHPGIHLLAHHFRRDGVTFRELADAVRMRGPTTVGVVKDMEALGLVRRERNAVEGRKVNLFLTAKGRRAWKAVLPEVAAINRHAESGLAAAAARELKRLLRRVRTNFDRDSMGGN